MKVLYVGGTGEISASCVKESTALGHDVTIFNRGKRRANIPEGVRVINGDMNNDEDYRNIVDEGFDVVCQFFVFEPEQIKRDIDFFLGNVGQYVFISTASAYQKPMDRFSVITEQTPLNNIYWEYSQKKILIEEILLSAYTEQGFPVTIIRPSHTYRAGFPVPLFDGDWTAQRILDGKPVLVHGDGTSLWTLTHADDFARPFARLLGNSRTTGEAYHITQDDPYTWLEIMSAMADALGSVLDYVTVPSETIVRYLPQYTGDLLGDKTPSTVFNNEKVKSVAGDFTCNVSLQQGMAGVAEAFRQRTDSLTSNHEFDRVCDRIISEQKALA